MQLFFQSFGVNLVSLIWFVVLFGLVLLILRRYAFGPILRTIENRQTQINDSLDRAAEAQKSVEESQHQAQQTLVDASSQAQEIIRRAERAATELQEQARADAKTQADQIIEKAREEIGRERAAAVAEIRSQVVDLTVAAASRLLEANLDDARNRKLVEDTIQQAEIRA